jgi:hypothetical protein
VSPAKPANEAAVPRAEGKGQKKAISSLRTKPEELPEIKHNCYMEWDDILMAPERVLQASLPGSGIKMSRSDASSRRSIVCAILPTNPKTRRPDRPDRGE